MSDEKNYLNFQFPGYEYKTQVILSDLNDFLMSFYNTIVYIQFRFVQFSLLLNIPHIFILCQKSMQTSSTNVFLLSIAICDFIEHLFNIYFFYFFDNRPFSSNFYCEGPPSWLEIWISWMRNTIKYHFQSTSIYLGVIMSIIRIVMIKNVMNPKYDIVSTRNFGIIIVFLTNILNINTYAYYMRRESDSNSDWVNDGECSNYPENYTAPIYAIILRNYSIVSGESLESAYKLIDSGSQVVVSFVIVICTISLIYEIRKSSKLSANTNSYKKSYRTTRLVTVLAVFHVISVFPFGVIILCTYFKCN